ncbi:MAG TPA: pectin acetylesterase-family hydrolase, partial [Ilumatobacteraceae bacterium]|nr:pectin acetylesterase-family hydrolase [Ilumatobacteraceae bacterium]
GGACFSAETCDPVAGRYKTAIGADEDPSKLATGIFDRTNPDNPLADYSLVFVPYCTGDVHIGNADHDYGNGLTVHHRGFLNGSAALDTLAAEFPNAEHVVVAGESAGSVATPLFAGLAADRLPKAAITVIADGSGAYPDVPAVNATVGAIWGTSNVIPDWPVNKGMTAADYSIPGLFVQSGKHAPRIVFGRYDYAFDQTQEFFAGIAGFSPDRLIEMIDQNETQIEAKGVTIHSYTASGNDHTILHTPEFYTQTVNGTKLVDWITNLVAGKPDADVHCTACTP